MHFVSRLLLSFLFILDASKTNSCTNETLLELAILKFQYFFNVSVTSTVVRGRWYLPFGRLHGNTAPSAGQSALHTQEEVPLALLFLA